MHAHRPRSSLFFLFFRNLRAARRPRGSPVRAAFSHESDGVRPESVDTGEAISAVTVAAHVRFRLGIAEADIGVVK
jgi:hypothetical protein